MASISVKRLASGASFLATGIAASLLIVPEKKASPPAISALDLIQFLRLSEFAMVLN
jgi:hypothetical protein